MNPSTRNEAYPADAQPVYLDVPAGHGRWRTSQLRDAGIHTTAQYAGGVARLGPLSREEYAAAQAILAGQTRTPDRIAKWGMWLLIAGLGAAIIVFAPVVLPAAAFLVVVGGVVAVCMAAMGLESWTMTRRARLGRRHPDPNIRSFAKRVWWTPAAGWIIAMILSLLLLAAMAFSLGLM